MRNVSLDEQRHIGFGVKLLADLYARGPGADRRRDRRRRCARCSRGRRRSPSRRAGTRRYMTRVRLHLRRPRRGGRALAGAEAARDRPAGRLAAGLPDGHDAAAARARAPRADHAPAGNFIGPEPARSRATPRRSSVVFDAIARSADPRAGARRHDGPVGLHRRRAVARRPGQRLDAAQQGPAAKADVTLRMRSRTSATHRRARRPAAACC